MAADSGPEKGLRQGEGGGSGPRLEGLADKRICPLPTAGVYAIIGILMDGLPSVFHADARWRMAGSLKREAGKPDFRGEGLYLIRQGFYPWGKSEV